MRRFYVHQRENGAGEAAIGCTVSALRFLFTVMSERPDLSRKLDNVLKFGPPAGEIKLLLRSVGAAPVITIADEGDGVPIAERPLVAER